MMDGTKPKVLLVGDSSALASLEGVLVAEDYEVAAVGDGGEALWMVGAGSETDVILLDLGPPTLQGFLACERIRAADPGVVIVLLSDGGAEEDVVRGLDAGADDYVARPFSPEVLMARVRAHFRGRLAAGERRILEVGDLWLDARNYVLRVKGEWVALRPQEFRLLVALARANGKPMSRQELVLRVLGKWRGASSRTVDVNISRVRAALEARSDYFYIHTVKAFGYRFEPVPKQVGASSGKAQKAV